ncbi:MAG: F0F1 ATP synthase subunit A [Candidatus Tectomicrobia bacterium]|uniref:ATP synthase subunit a n=1 Tax=Tectimicrobiota bacterium TaxID=2528274 RepID=A0A932GMR6_UNCTE|nr:F0F1 ATP synthase subunit A [Candidatus Tectomicrobia bacterium]
MEEHPFTWFSLIPGLAHQPNHVVGALLVFLLLLLFALAVRLNLKKTNFPMVPQSRLHLIAEILVDSLLNFLEGIIGHGARKFLPLLGAIFLFILVSNLLGLIPGFLPPTESFNTNLAAGAFIFLMYNYYGFREHGFKYVKQFLGPVLPLAPLMLIIELVSHAFRPFSLALRLTGNIFGDHLVFSIFSSLISVLIPVIFLALGLAVSIIQAFVFTLLSTVYISLAISHEH